jgi:hypothetical protein
MMTNSRAMKAKTPQTMTDYKSKSVLVMDKGMFTSLADVLTKHFWRVGYFSDWQSSFPDGTNLLVGSGLDGVTRLKYLWKRTPDNPQCIYDFDLIVFADCWDGDLQEDLRSRGMRVWGSGMRSSLELSRWKTKEEIKKAGLPVNKCAQVTGIENLRAYLKENQDVYVKISTFRGIGETFHAENYDQIKGKLDELEAKYEPMMEIMQFVIEHSIPDAKELGYDGYCIDGEFPNSAFFGAEIKNKAYFGKLVDYDDLPEEIKTVNTKLSYGMDGYRHFFSTELRDGHPIDLTCRHATPCGEPYCDAMTNLADVLYQGAEGTLVHAEWSSKYAAQLVFCSEWAEEHPVLVQFPEEIRPYVKLYNHCRVNGKDWIINDAQRAKEMGSIVALGNTPQEVMRLCIERVEKVKAFMLTYDEDALQKAVDEMGAQ